MWIIHDLRGVDVAILDGRGPNLVVQLPDGCPVPSCGDWLKLDTFANAKGTLSESDAHWRVCDVDASRIVLEPDFFEPYEEVPKHPQYDPFEAYVAELERPAPVIVLGEPKPEAPLAPPPEAEKRDIHLFRWSHSLHSHMYCGVKVSRTGSPESDIRYSEEESRATCPLCLTILHHEPFGE